MKLILKKDKNETDEQIQNVKQIKTKLVNFNKLTNFIFYSENYLIRICSRGPHKI